MTGHLRLIVTGVACVALFAACAVLASTDLGGAGPLRHLLGPIVQVQGDLYRALATGLRGAKSTYSPWPLFLLFSVSFLYGVFHAVGPGHGKVIISSYLVASGSQVRQGLMLSFVSSFIQAMSAVVVVGVLALVFDLTRLQIDATGQLVEEASYGLIVLIGVWMLVSSLERGASHDHDHGLDHPSVAGSDRTNEAFDRGARRSTRRRAAAVVFATGIRPCSGAILVLLFTLAQGMFPMGVAATFVMAFGTGITISTLAIMAVLSRRAALRMAAHDSKWQSRVHRSLAVVSSAAVVATGSLLLVATLAQPMSL